MSDAHQATKSAVMLSQACPEYNEGKHWCAKAKTRVTVDTRTPVGQRSPFDKLRVTPIAQLSEPLIKLIRLILLMQRGYDLMRQMLGSTPASKARKGLPEKRAGSMACGLKLFSG